MSLRTSNLYSIGFNFFFFHSFSLSSKWSQMLFFLSSFACVFLCEHCMYAWFLIVLVVVTLHAIHVSVMLHVLFGFKNDIGLVGIYRDCHLGLVPWWIPCECLDHVLLLCYWSFCHVCCGFVLLFLVTCSRDCKCVWNFMLINVCNLVIGWDWLSWENDTSF